MTGPGRTESGRTESGRPGLGLTAAPTLVWFRQDLRLADNPALHAAAGRSRPVIAVFIESFAEEGDWPPGAAQRWWLHESLRALDTGLRACGAALVLRRGAALDVLRELVRQTGADAVYWNRRYEPAAVSRDGELKRQLRLEGLQAESFNSALLIEPWEIANQGGRPFQVFTPFWRAALQRLRPSQPLAAPQRLVSPSHPPPGLDLAELGLLPHRPWYRSLAAAWKPGEAGAQRTLQTFLERALPAYGDLRDRPAADGTSRLSPHLHWGEISPRQLWQRIGAAEEARGLAPREWLHGKFLSELLWREFAHHLLYYFPATPLAPLRGEFGDFGWRTDSDDLEAWQRGQTGIPLVDAGMRQLWETGWMHNRIRMVVASFLTRNLRLPWQQGARWFWDTLVDADLANNTFGWQWSAGCGADAAPYFRIFNPILQSRRFDPGGEYLRRWLPELASLDADRRHAPWEFLPAQIYPRPRVDLAASRREAIEAWRQMRRSGVAP